MAHPDRDYSILDQAIAILETPTHVDLDDEFERQATIQRASAALDGVHRKWERASAYDITTNVPRVDISSEEPVLEIPMRPGVVVSGDILMSLAAGAGMPVEFISEPLREYRPQDS